MANTLSPVTLEQAYPPITVGTLTELSDRLYLELAQSGYALMPEDIQAVMIEAASMYAAWATFNIQETQDTAQPLDGSLPLDASEWFIMQPLVRSHCDLLQARRMEGAGSLGGERFGLSVGEAQQIYDLAREALPKDATVIAPYSIELS